MPSVLGTTSSPSSSSSSSSSDRLKENAFLVQLAATFHVESIPLAIFILIVILILCLLIIGFILCCIRSRMRKRMLNKRKQPRMKSFYLDELPGTDGKIGDFGQLTYKLGYDMSTSTLHLTIVEARALRTVPESKMIDAYATCIVALHPEGGAVKQLGEVFKTDVKRSTTTPRWHFTGHVKIPEAKLKETVIRFEIFDYDSLGQDMSIGRLGVSLHDKNIEDLVGGELECIEWLQSGLPKYLGLGEMCIGLAWKPSTEQIEIYIYEARNLKIENLMGNEKKPTVDVQVEMFEGTRVRGTFVTSSKTDLVNPYYNDKTVFSLKKEQLKQVRLVFEMRRSGQLRRRKQLAFLSIGPGSALTTGEKHWNEMQQSMPRTHVMWHTWSPIT